MNAVKYIYTDIAMQVSMSSFQRTTCIHQILQSIHNIRYLLTEMGFKKNPQCSAHNNNIVQLVEETRGLYMMVDSNLSDPTTPQDILQEWASMIQHLCEQLFGELPDVRPNILSCAQHLHGIEMRLTGYHKPAYC